MAYVVEPITESRDERDRLATFLSGFEDDSATVEEWRERLAFWWDRNPFQSAGLPLGWVLKHDSQLVGFFGVIATPYSGAGRQQVALNGTSWRVLQAHRHRSLDLFLKFHELRASYTLFNTTPTGRVCQILDRLGYQRFGTELQTTLPILSSRALSRFILGPGPRGVGKDVVGLDGDFVIPAPADDGRMRKLVSPEYVRWYCSSPTFEKEFLGYAGPDKVLSSYVIIGRRRRGKSRKLRLVDFYTSLDDGRELLGLLGLVCSRHRSIRLCRDASLLKVVAPAASPLFSGRIRWPLRADASPAKYYCPPPHLRNVERAAAGAEGDYGC